MENKVKEKQKIKCACGEEFDTKKSFVFHILTLGCFDENLIFKEAKK